MAQSGDTAGANPASSSSGDTGAFDDVDMDEVRPALSNPDPQAFTEQSQCVAWLQAFLCWRPDTTGTLSQFADSNGDLSLEDQDLVLHHKDANEYTALHRAVVENYVGMVELLGTYRIFRSFKFLHSRTCVNGWTALHLAVFCKNPRMVDLLMEWYEDCDGLPSPRDWDFRDDRWKTPLQYAVVAGSIEVVCHLLRRYYPDGGHVNRDSVAVKHLVTARDCYKRSALHIAVGHGARVMVEGLLASPLVDPNLVDCCGYTPLHWAVYAGAADMVRLFTSKATERTIRMTEEDSQGRSVLQFAIENPAIDRKVGKDIQKLLLTVTEVKDEVQALYRDRQVFVDAANAILVGAALIAGVTFGGWLQPPEGSNLELQIFWAFNSLSFFFSLATVLAGAGAVLPMSEVYIGKAVRSIRRWLAVTSFFLLISVLLVLGAFAAAGFASLRPISSLYRNMTCTTSVGSVVCFTTALFFLDRLVKIKVQDDFMLVINDISSRMGHSTFRRGHEVRSRLELRRLLAAQFDRKLREAIKRAGINSQIDAGAREYYATNAVKHISRASLKAMEAIDPPASMEVREDAFQLLSTVAMYEEVGGKGHLGEAELTWVRLFVADISPEGFHNWGDVPEVLCRGRALQKDSEELEFAMNFLREKKKQIVEERNIDDK